jgi:plastocyanin
MKEKTMKKKVALVFVVGVLSILVVACGQGAAANSSGGSSNHVIDVHMGTHSFLQSSVTIKQGDSLNLINDASDVHLINLGQWVNGAPKPEQEPGAPQIHNLEFAGNAGHEVGPWNTPGTYHLYCTVHQNMQITVVVQ